MVSILLTCSLFEAIVLLRIYVYLHTSISFIRLYVYIASESVASLRQQFIIY